MVEGGRWLWCKPIIMSNPQLSYFGLLLGWVAVAWLGFGVMTILQVVVVQAQNLGIAASVEKSRTVD